MCKYTNVNVQEEDSAVLAYCMCKYTNVNVQEEDSAVLAYCMCKYTNVNVQEEGIPDMYLRFAYMPTATILA